MRKSVAFIVSISSAIVMALSGCQTSRQVESTEDEPMTLTFYDEIVSCKSLYTFVPYGWSGRASEDGTRLEIVQGTFPEDLKNMPVLYLSISEKEEEGRGEAVEVRDTANRTWKGSVEKKGNDETFSLSLNEGGKVFVASGVSKVKDEGFSLTDDDVKTMLGEVTVDEEETKEASESGEEAKESEETAKESEETEKEE